MNSDAFSVRAVIVILGLVVLGGTYTLCRLALDGQEIPALLSTLVIGTLALLVPSPLTKAKTTEPVAVKTEPGDVVATTPAETRTDGEVSDL